MCYKEHEVSLKSIADVVSSKEDKHLKDKM
jgi:hypothetical protein